MKNSYINRVKSWTLALLFAVFAGGTMMSITAPVPVSAATADCAQPFLTFPVWYRGIVGDAPECNLLSPDQVPGGLQSYIWRIVLNVLDIGLQLVGYLAVGFILYGGFQFLTSQGSPDGSVKARKTILNAVIGLVISIASIGIVNLIMGIMP